MWAPGNPSWAGVDTIDYRELPPAMLVPALVRAAPRYDAVILNGAQGFRHGYRDLVGAAALARCSHGPQIVISDATWEPGSRAIARLARRDGLALERLARTAIAAIDSPRVTYCVLSTHERETFPRTWGVDPARVVFTPFSHTLWSAELADPPEGDYIFAGGTPQRDYATLVEAVRDLPWRLRIATRASLARLPAHIEAGAVTPERFLELLRGAALVVVPLEGGTLRSAGQQTYLNAMALGKPLVVSDAPGVRDYVDDGRTGLVVPAGNAARMRAAIERAMDPRTRPELTAMRSAARAAAYERFSPLLYPRRLVEVAGAAVAGGGA